MEIQISISPLIFTHIYIPKALLDNDIHALQNGRKNFVVIIHMNVARAVFLLLNDYTDTESEELEIKIGISALILTNIHI